MDLKASLIESISAEKQRVKSPFRRPFWLSALRGYTENKAIIKIRSGRFLVCHLPFNSLKDQRIDRDCMVSTIEQV